MPRFEESFEEILDQVDTPLPELRPDEMDRIYGLLLKRADIPPKRRRPRRHNNTLLLAAAISGTLLLAAAEFYSVSDAFRGVLKDPAPSPSAEQTLQIKHTPQSSPLLATPQKEEAKLEKSAPLVNKTGVLPAQSVRLNGLEATLRAAVFSENGYKIIVDVKTTDGSPLDSKKLENVKAYANMSFSEGILTVEGLPEIVAHLDANEMDGRKPGDSHTSFLLEGDGIPKEARGKKATLTLKDLIQYFSYNKPSKMLVTGDETNLDTLFKALPTANMSDFEAYEVTNRRGEVTKIRYERIVPATNPGIPFTRLKSDFLIDTIFLDANGGLYMYGTAPSESDAIKVRSFVLKDLRTGEVLYDSGGPSGWSTDKDGKIYAWDKCFTGIKSADDLKYYTIVNIPDGVDMIYLSGKNAAENNGAPSPDVIGTDTLVLSRGEYVFTFPLDYESFDRLSPIDVPLTLGDHVYRSQWVSISPFGIELMLHMPDQTGKTDTSRGWLDKDLHTPAKLTLKDKTGITVQYDGSNFDQDTMNLQVHYTFTSVIDPQLVHSITIGSTEIPLA